MLELNPPGFPKIDGVDVIRIAPERGGRAAPHCISARDLYSKVFPPIKYVVPNYIAEGLTLLAGKPKIGKSWMVMDFALAVASGGCCLGNVQCEQGDVLYLALEDNDRRLNSRLHKLWAYEDLAGNNPIPDRLFLRTDWKRAGEGGIEDIKAWTDEHPAARLIIVDVLMMFRATARSQEQTTLYQADYEAIKGLQSLAMETGVAIVVVHHTRKSASDSGDPFEKVSGTLGLSGAADTTIILDRDQNGATLYGRGRDIEEIETAVMFDKPTCRWSVLGKAADVRRTDERADILSNLIDASEPMNPRDLSIACDMARNSVDQLLFKMAKAGEVLKVGRGLYIHPERGDLAPLTPSPSTPRKNDKKVRSATEGGSETTNV